MDERVALCGSDDQMIPFGDTHTGHKKRKGGTKLIVLSASLVHLGESKGGPVSQVVRLIPSQPGPVGQSVEQQETSTWGNRRLSWPILLDRDTRYLT